MLVVDIIRVYSQRLFILIVSKLVLPEVFLLDENVKDFQILQVGNVKPYAVSKIQKEYKLEEHLGQLDEVLYLNSQILKLLLTQKVVDHSLIVFNYSVDPTNFHKSQEKQSAKENVN